jgi:hypothetical protein
MPVFFIPTLKALNNQFLPSLTINTKNHVTNSFRSFIKEGRTLIIEQLLRMKSVDRQFRQNKSF